MRTAALGAPTDDARSYGRRDRRRFADHLADLVTALCRTTAEPAAHRPGGDDPQAAAFASGLYGLADLARDRGGLCAALRSESAARVLETACRAPGARRRVHPATVPDYLAFADRLERALRPLSLDWYDPADGLGAADLCHAASGGTAALPGLVAKRFFGTPLLVTEYGVQLRAHYLSAADARLSPPVRALLAAFQRRLATEVYRRADAVTPGSSHARRWQERCGADRSKIRTIHPGLEAERFAAVGEAAPSAGDDRTLVWVGRVEPGKDLVGLLHAFAQVHRELPHTRLRVIAAPVRDAGARGYLTHCAALAAQLFPDEAAGAHAVGESPVTFEEIGGPEVPDLPSAYAAGCVSVLSSVVEGFPLGLVEAMLCARATVSTDAGAVVEVIGGTGLVVPPRNPRALAGACLALLRDPERRQRLGAAARARALELFTAEQNVAAFHALYLELLSLAPVHRESEAVDTHGDPVPFAHPAETRVPVPWTAAAPARHPPGPRTPAAAPRTAAAHGCPPPAPHAPAGAAPSGVPVSERTAPAPARGPADPVKVLLHRHRDLCERAVDPLEIAAGLEARGLTDRTAARFRHRDVFSLAEELYARVPRGGDERPRPAGARAAGTAQPAARWLPAALLPAAAAGLTAAAHAGTTGPVRTAATAAGLLALAAATGAALRHGPLRAPGRTPFGLTGWTVLLLAYAAYGDGLLDQLVRGGLHEPWPPRPGRSSGWPSPCRRRPPAPGCSPYGPGSGSPPAAAWTTSPRGPGRCCSPWSRSSSPRPPVSPCSPGSCRARSPGPSPRPSRWACCCSRPGCWPSTGTARPRRPGSERPAPRRARLRVTAGGPAAAAGAGRPGPARAGGRRDLGHRRRTRRGLRGGGARPAGPCRGRPGARLRARPAVTAPRTRG
nr:glycosyltransferase [Streptomyces sp. CC228A]